MQIAGLGLLLSAVGIYGVVANLATERTKEIGVRMILGAQPVDILWLFVRNGLILACTGATVGLVGAFALVATLDRIMPELSGKNPIVMAGAAAVLMGVAILACWLPARRAPDGGAAFRVNGSIGRLSAAAHCVPQSLFAETPTVRWRQDGQVNRKPRSRQGGVDRPATGLCRGSREHAGRAMLPVNGPRRHRSGDNPLRLGGPRQWPEPHRGAPVPLDTNLQLLLPRPHSGAQLSAPRPGRWQNHIVVTPPARRAEERHCPARESSGRRQLRPDAATGRYLPPTGSFFIVRFGLSQSPGNILALKPRLKFGASGAEKLDQGSAHELLLRIKPAVADHPGDVVGDLIGHFDVERFHGQQDNSFSGQSNHNFAL